MSKQFCIIVVILFLNIPLKAVSLMGGLCNKCIKISFRQKAKEIADDADELYFPFFDFENEDIEPEEHSIVACHVTKSVYPHCFCSLNSTQTKIGLILFEADMSPPLFL